MPRKVSLIEFESCRIYWQYMYIYRYRFLIVRFVLTALFSFCALHWIDTLGMELVWEALMIMLISWLFQILSMSFYNSQVSYTSFTLLLWYIYDKLILDFRIQLDRTLVILMVKQRSQKTRKHRKTGLIPILQQSSGYLLPCQLLKESWFYYVT